MWTIFSRTAEDAPWTVLMETEDKDKVDFYVVQLNDQGDFQRYACERQK